MKQDSEYVNKQLKILEALIEVLPRESCISLYDILCDCKDSGEAKQKIMEFFEFTEEQAEAVYDMRMKSFSLENADEIKKEFLELKKIQMMLINSWEKWEIIPNEYGK